METVSDTQTFVTRSWLQTRENELRERVRRVESDLRGRGDPLPADSAEAAVAAENDEVLKDIRAAALDELRSIDAALQRLDRGQFAICEHCGGPIEPARLRAAPYATRCAPCAQQG